MRSEIKISPHPAFPDASPFKIGRRFIVFPEKSEAGTGRRIPLHLSSGKAFGSGLHETTISCVEEMEKLPSLEKSSVLDIGTGTGILSLAALKLGAALAVAMDIDIDAARVCRQNAFANDLSEKLKIYLGTVDALHPAQEFGLILCNIHGDIILKEASKFRLLASEGGIIILSGMDYTDSTQVKGAMSRNGMKEMSVIFLKEYVTQVWHCP